MEFIKAFEEIDVDDSGEITREELEDYMNRKKYKPQFVEKWLKIFDADNSGTITLEEFTSTLGIIPAKKHQDIITKRKLQNQLRQQLLETGDEENMIEKFMDDYEILGEDPDINNELREYCVNLSKDMIRMHALSTNNSITPPKIETIADAELEIAKRIKRKLDARYKRCWHVVVGRFGYGSFVSHEYGMFIHIRVREWAIVMWQVLEKTANVGIVQIS